jgi:dienelactone hydrolase
MKRSIVFAAAAFATAALILPWSVRAEGGKGEAIAYKQGDVELEGYLALPAGTAKGAVIVFHEWWGLGDYERHRADQLAELGYAAFAADVYGKGVRTDDPKKAGELMGAAKKSFRERAAAGLAAFKASKAHPEHVAAIGYCMGGSVALELARSGADLRGVVAFHAGLATDNPADAKNIKGKILVCSGGDDGFVPPEQIQAFEKEMRDAHVDWELISYGGAVHAFTNPAADSHGIKGIGYNEKADHRSWKAMQDFFAEIFSK